MINALKPVGTQRAALILTFTVAASVTGIALAMLPAPTAALWLAISVLSVLTFIEPIGGVIVLLLVAPLKALVETEASLALPLDVGQLALLFVFGTWILNRVSQRRPLALRWTSVTMPLLLVIATASLSLPGAFSLGHGLAEIAKWVGMLALVYFCLAVFRRSDAHWLVFGLVVAGGAQAVIGAYQFMGGSGAEHLLILDNQHFRAFGSFGQPNPFGAFMGLTAPLAAGSALGYAAQTWRAVRERPRSWQALTSEADVRSSTLAACFYGFMAGLIIIGRVVSWSLGAWMGFAGAAAVMIFFLPRSLLKSLAGIVVIAVLGLVLWNSRLVPDVLRARLSGFLEELTTVDDVRGLDITDSNYAVAERVAHWQSAVMMAQDHPWLGVGFGNYEVAYPSYALLNWPQPLGHAHNYYLNLLAEVGIVGFTAYLIAWIMIFGLTIRAWRHGRGLERAWSLALLGTWSYLTIHSAVDKLYVNNMFLHLGCMLGLLALLRSASGSDE